MSEELKDSKEIIKQCSQKRTRTTTTTSGFGTGLREDDFEKEVSVRFFSFSLP